MKSEKESSASDKHLLKQLKLKLNLALEDIKEKGLLEIIRSQVTNQLTEKRELRRHCWLFPMEKYGTQEVKEKFSTNTKKLIVSSWVTILVPERYMMTPR